MVGTLVLTLLGAWFLAGGWLIAGALRPQRAAATLKGPRHRPHGATPSAPP